MRLPRATDQFTFIPPGTTKIFSANRKPSLHWTLKGTPGTPTRAEYQLKDIRYWKLYVLKVTSSANVKSGFFYYEWVFTLKEARKRLPTPSPSKGDFFPYSARAVDGKFTTI